MGPQYVIRNQGKNCPSKGRGSKGLLLEEGRDEAGEKAFELFGAQGQILTRTGG